MLETPDQAAMVRNETRLNTIATAVIAAGLSWLIFRGAGPIIAISPPVGGILGTIPGTFNFTFLVSIALTLITRRRVRRGLYPPLGARGRPYLGAGLPRNIILRSLLLACVATLTFVAISVGLVWAMTHSGLLPVDWSFGGMLIFYVAYFVILSITVTPIVLWRALGD